MSRFFSNSFFKKKSVYSQTTFTLLLILYFSLMGFSYFYYEQGIEEYSKLKISDSHLDILSFVEQKIIKALVLENQSINFQDDSFLEYTEITFELSSVIITTFENTYIVNNSYSLFGVSFCDSYSIVLEIENQFIYNGSCIQVMYS